MNPLWEFIDGGYQQTEAYNPYFTDILIYSPDTLAVEPRCDRDSLLFALNPGAEVLCNKNLENLCLNLSDDILLVAEVFALELVVH